MTEFHLHKELEKKVHEQLYNNLYLLSRCYPTSTDFNRIFKKDMFIKNNKAAFHQVVYYLLQVLNPQLTREKLTSWPPYDIKLENKFRGELLRYINELNSLYDNSDIPPIMTSQLISPGGFKVAKFILKLSQLVMQEHLKKTNITVLSTVKPSKNTSMTKTVMNNLNIQVASIERNTRKQLDEFNTLQEQYKIKAKYMVENSSKLEKQIMEAKNRLSEMEENSYRQNGNHQSLNSLNEKFLSLHKEWDSLQCIHELFKEADTLLSNLKSGNLVLENEEDSAEKDLIDEFHKIKLLLQEKALELPYTTNEFIDKKIEDLQILNKSYSQQEKEILERKSGLMTLMGIMQKNVDCISDLIHVQEKSIKKTVDNSDDTLGVKPLEN